jgi:hypothetical protein
MPNVNDDGTVHASFVETFPGPPPTEVRFWPYDGGTQRDTLKAAINIIEKNIFGKISSCNSYFGSLPNGRTFDAIWGDPAFWINRDPRKNAPFRGATATTRAMEITLSPLVLTNPWVCAATIVHEMAHLNGAWPGAFPGWPGSAAAPGDHLAAEKSLLHCGLQKGFDAHAIGLQRDFADLQTRNRLV